MNELIPKTPEGTKCKRCRGQALFPLPSHNINLCADCLVHFFQTAVRRAMKKFPISKETPLLVAVSGGKDSLVVWEVLHDLGYITRGVHVDLGIDDFSEASAATVEQFAHIRNLPWNRYSLKDLLGYTIPEIQKRTRRKICSVCGFLKRQMLNRLCVQEGFRMLVTGHNLDDEAGRLLGNLVRHRSEYLEKQYPFMPSIHPRFPTKLKPLYRLEAYEIRAYCEVKGITPVETKCPFSRGATSHFFKEALNFLEAKMPGTKRDFLFTHFDQATPPTTASSPFETCRQCGEPAYGSVCSVCNLLNLLREKEIEREKAEGKTPSA